MCPQRYKYRVPHAFAGLTVLLQTGMESIVEEYLMKHYEGVLLRIVRIKKEDLKMVRCLLGQQGLY